MLRGIWTYCVLAVVTALLSLPVAVLVLLVPRWGNLAMIAGKIWSRIMLAVVGAHVSYEGLEHIPRRSPAVFMANHQSNVDIWALIEVLPLTTRFVAKQELFRIPILGWALTASGFIPLNRANRTESIRSLERAAMQVRRGTSVVLFPEGTRSRDGRIRPFKKGAFHLALQAGVPVVPVAIRGSFGIMPPGSLRVRPGRVWVSFEQPIDVAPFQPANHEELLAEVHTTIERRLYPPAAPERATAP